MCFVNGLNAGSAQAQDCGEVTITEMDWGSAIIVTQVAKFLLEQGYGCSVTTVPSASVPALASVSETGKPDIITELWTNGAPAYVPLLEAGKINELTSSFRRWLRGSIHTSLFGRGSS